MKKKIVKKAMVAPKRMTAPQGVPQAPVGGGGAPMFKKGGKAKKC